MPKILFCGIFFSNTYDFYQYMARHADRPYGCPVEGCPFRANKKASIRRHVKGIHRRVRRACVMRHRKKVLLTATCSSTKHQIKTPEATSAAHDPLGICCCDRCLTLAPLKVKDEEGHSSESPLLRFYLSRPLPTSDHP